MQNNPIKQQRNIPSLDGLRAISITLVIVSHLAIGFYHDYSQNFTRLGSIIQTLFLVGHLGVTVFFVISGFLITSILLKERSVNLKKFYFRRLLRIFPPYYFYLCIILILWLSGIWESSWPNFFSALTFTKNYFFDNSAAGSWNLAHTWSLSVEEQFYILFPIVLFLIGKRWGLVFICFVIVVCPLFRLLNVYNDPAAYLEFMKFEAVADSLAVGCLLAIIRDWLHKFGWYIRFLRSRILLGLPLLALLITWLARFPGYCPKPLYVVLAIPIQNISIVLFLDRVITYYQGRLGRFLNAAPIAFIGVMSYSIYLWQQIFLNPELDLPILIKLPLALLASFLSYFIVEKSSLKARNYLEKKFNI
jgi:peptidoglycan/LPS O-acetylase OafA/YrhL